MVGPLSAIYPLKCGSDVPRRGTQPDGRELDTHTQPQATILRAAQLTSLLRAVAAPDDEGAIPADRAATIKLVETNLARYRDAA